MSQQIEPERIEPSDLALEAFKTDLQAVIESTDDLIALRDRKNRLVLFNPSFAALAPHLFGAEATPGLCTLDYLPAPARQHWAEVLARVLQGDSHTEELAWPVEGVTHHFELTIRPVYAGDEIIGSVEFTRDITGRKQMEEALRNESANLTSLIENIDGSIWSVDREYRLLVSNSIFDQAVTKIFGAPFKVGESIANRGSNADAEWRAYYDRALSGERFSIERTQPFVTPSRWKEYFFNPIIDQDGGITGVTVFGRDITTRKQAELERTRLQDALAQAQNMEIVSRLAGGVAHEFNNAFTAILLSTQMALPAVVTDAVLTNYLMTIQTAAQRSAELVQQLLTFARQQMVSPAQLDLGAAVGAALPTLRQLVGERIDLVWRPAQDVWPVRMEAAQVNQILFNLCANARNAIDAVGSIEITVQNMVVTQPFSTYSRSVSPGEYVQLVVADNGRGMDMDTVDHIFEPFFTTRTIGAGVGLGLAIVEGILQQNDGAIQVTSSPGQGCTIAIYLPRGDGAPGSLALTSQRAAPTILLVESDPIVRKASAEVLQFAGYNVITASTPQNALQDAQNHLGSIDLLMTEVIMPAMNGQELARRIRIQHPETRVLYTADHADDAILRSGAAPLAAEILHRPYTLTRLATAIQKALHAT